MTRYKFVERDLPQCLVIRLAGAFTRDFSAISFTIRQIQCSSILFDLCQIAFQNSESFRAGGELRP
jgi:hypothetical protein